MRHNPYEAPRSAPFKPRHSVTANPQVVAGIFAAIILIVLLFGVGVVAAAIWMAFNRPMF